MPKRKSRSRRSRAPAAKPKTTSKPAPKANGRPEFVPTAEQRALVHTMAGYRIPQDEMALLVINPGTGRPISETTLKKVFEAEISSGYANLRVRIMAASVRSALGEVESKRGPDGQVITTVKKDGNVTAQIWLQKTLYGAREPGREGGDNPPPPAPAGAEDTGILDAARRIAFTLRIGVQAAKKAA